MEAVVVTTPILSLIAGIIILIFPKVLNYVIAIYLILVGLVGLAPHLLRGGDKGVRTLKR